MNNWHRKIWTLEQPLPPLAVLFRPSGTNKFWFEPFADPADNKLRFRVQFGADALPDCWLNCVLEPIGVTGPESGDAERLEGTMDVAAGDQRTLQVFMGHDDDGADELRIRFKPAGEGGDTGFAKGH
jgi:hypothetical protein